MSNSTDLLLSISNEMEQKNFIKINTPSLKTQIKLRFLNEQQLYTLINLNDISNSKVNIDLSISKTWVCYILLS